MCHLLTQAVVDGVASSVFSGPEFFGCSAWKTLMEECEGRIHREPEAKRVRVQLNTLRLDNRINGYEHGNNF